MADLEKNYVGKVVRVHYIDRYRSNEVAEITGIVSEQKESGDAKVFSLIKMNGQAAMLNTRYDRIEKITSVRLEKGVREALEGLYLARKEQKTVLEALQKKKVELEQRVETAEKRLQAETGELTHKEVREAVEAFFREHFHTSNAFWRNCYFYVSSIGPKELTIAHVQDVTKYATPEQFPFIYREYDGQLFVRDKHPALQDFAERNAPQEIRQLSGKVKNTLSVSIGDKNYLSVSRCYTLPLKYGLNRKSIENLKEFVLSPAKGKPSLDEQIGAARPNAGKTAGKNRNLGRGGQGER